MPEVTRDEVKQKLEDFLVDELWVDREKLTPQAHFFEDLGLDSLDVAAAVNALEEQYSIVIREEDLPHMVVLGDCIELITKRAQAVG